MPRTFIRQEVQIANSEAYDDTIAPSSTNFETNPTNIETDLNTIRSMLSYLKDAQAGNWYDTLLVPSTFEGGAARAIDDLNQDLHDLEHKRVLRFITSLVDVTVPNTQNYVVLGTGELPPNTTAAIGNVTTLGTVLAYVAAFGAHSLTELAGASAISPKNLIGVVDGATRDPILDSSGRRIYGLAQSESNTDGSTITDTTPARVQVSFVVLHAAGNDLIACLAADIQNKVVNFQWVERVHMTSLTEQDFLRGAAVDVPSAATVTRQVAYDNQGTTPVEQTTNAILDLNSAGVYWELRDLANATLLRLTEGSTGGTTVLLLGTDVDTFDVNAIVNDFNSGVRARTGGSRPIHVGVNDGVVETTAGDLRLFGAGEVFLDDGNQAGSTWAQTSGIKLSETTGEWDDFEARFGEVSLLNALAQAYDAAAPRIKLFAVLTADVAANADVSGPTDDNNLDTDLGDLSGGDFEGSYDVYLNGVLLRPGATAGDNHDYYPGTDLADGQLRFEFALKTGDQLALLQYTA